MATDPNHYYSVLGVAQNVDMKAIHKAYRKLALIYHPDRNVNCSEYKAEKFHEILTAYEILKDPHKRSIYDKYGEKGLKNNGLMPTNIDDLFDFMFSQQNNSDDNKYDDLPVIPPRIITVSLNELYYGTSKNIKVSYDIDCSQCKGEGQIKTMITTNCTRCHGTRRCPSFTAPMIRGANVKTIKWDCTKCNKTGKVYDYDISNCTKCQGHKQIHRYGLNHIVQINKGTRHGDHIKSAYKDDNISGYIEIIIKCDQNKKYSIKSNDLYMIEPVKINLYNVLCGGNFIVNHFNDKLKVECNWDIIQCNEYYKINGKGLLRKGTNSCGDLFVKFDILMPDLDKVTIQTICSVLIKDPTQQQKLYPNDIKPVKLEFDVNNNIQDEAENMLLDDDDNSVGLEADDNYNDQSPDCKTM